MPVTSEERELAEAIVRMYPIPPKSRKEIIVKYKKARNVLRNRAAFWSYCSSSVLLSKYIHMLEYPSHSFLCFINELWRNSEEWQR